MLMRLNCSITGKIAYAPQQPWIFSGTIKENILFGSSFQADKYYDVIEACALTKVKYISVMISMISTVQVVCDYFHLIKDLG